jgi:hypothetical protein
MSSLCPRLATPLHVLMPDVIRCDQEIPEGE